MGVKLTFAITVSLDCATGLAGAGAADLASAGAAGLAGAVALAVLSGAGGGGNCGWAGFSQNANHRCARGTGCLVYCVFAALAFGASPGTRFPTFESPE